MDLRWNRLGNTGGKTILKGLNVNKSIQIIELAGNKVSDEILRLVNDLLIRNKNGGGIDFVKPIGQVTGTSFKSY